MFNAPYSNTRSVAELVLAELILLMRRVPERSVQMHRREWQKSADDSFEVRGKTLGVVGYGNTGAQLGVLAEALGMRVVFHDIESKLNLGNAAQVGSLGELLAQSDVVSLHVPATPQTEYLLDSTALGAVKPGAVLVNASRGNVVDIDCLAGLLREGALLGACLLYTSPSPRDS